MQERRAIEIAVREITRALLPVEAKAAHAVEAGERADRRRDAQMLAAVFVRHLGQIHALMASVVEREIETDQIGIVRAQRMPAACMGADLFKALHDGSRSTRLAMLACAADEVRR